MKQINCEWTDLELTLLRPALRRCGQEVEWALLLRFEKTQKEGCLLWEKTCIHFFSLSGHGNWLRESLSRLSFLSDCECVIKKYASLHTHTISQTLYTHSLSIKTSHSEKSHSQNSKYTLASHNKFKSFCKQVWKHNWTLLWSSAISQYIYTI